MSKTYLTAIEHEKIKISNSQMSGVKSISSKDSSYLSTLENKLDQSFIKWNKTSLTFQQWVGVISMPDSVVEILPKISDTENNSGVRSSREALIHMLHTAYDIPIKKGIIAELNFSKRGFLDIFVTLFLRETQSQLKRGIIKGYQKVGNNLSTVKGKINFREQLRTNVIDKSKFYCNYSKFTDDIFINRIIKYTLIYLRNKPISAENKNLIKQLLVYLEGVTVCDVDMKSLDEITFDRNSKRFSQTIEYCKLLLNSYVLDLKIGDNKVNHLLFDMNKLFEKYIFKILRNTYKNNVYYQPSAYLLKNIDFPHKKHNRISPDIVLNNEEGTNLIIDTKWKVVNNFVNEKDVYQMFTYLNTLENSKEAILLYPKINNNDKIVGKYKYQTLYQEHNLSIQTIDLSVTSIERLQEFFSDVLGR
ncbi:5-methylcytosine-specific restriction enzyme subunit McrC [Alkalibacillus flavidus]|uniref:5-methylcytosine-specific restriction enzyme subunit McrC n=1 Tax=Alkalibacillus flavidus TaxID=546021 RepID=A0ABV2KTL6_9BACI